MELKLRSRSARLIAQPGEIKTAGTIDRRSSVAESTSEGGRDDTIKIVDIVVSTIDSEYRALRAEIGRLIDHQKDLHNFSFISLAALLAFIGVLAKDAKGAQGLTAVLLLVPLLTLQFALTAADLTRRILQLGTYINTLASLSNSVLRAMSTDKQLVPPVWQWENWKRNQFPQSSKFRTVGLEKSRWLALTFPGFLGIGAYVVLDETPLSSWPEWTLFICAVAVMGYSVLILVKYPSEAKGVPASVLASSPDLPTPTN
jgi:hypothetical protein